MSVKRKPVARVVAVINSSATGGSTKFVEIGSAWTTKNGRLIFSMEVEPLAWKDPFVPRTVLIQPTDRDKVIAFVARAEERPTEEVDYNNGGGDTPF